MNNIDAVLEKINDIAKVSATGDYIYRGEPADYGRVRSGLYRQYSRIKAEHFDVAVVQADILRAAHEYAPHKMEDFDLLATLQHFGDKTNLIDFTTDYLVALFFACDGEPKMPGRVILLPREPEGDPKPYEVKKPPRTIRRADIQKSIFVQAPKGFVEPDRTTIVTIPADLKSALLNYLRKHHDISTKTIYNDLQGFIENRGLHKTAYTEFYKGVTAQDRADSAKTEGEKRKWNNAAITHYDAAIELNPEYAEAYNNRGIAYSDRGDLELEFADYNKAIELKSDLAEAYNNRGVAYYKKGEFAAAIADYTKAIELDPEKPKAYNNRGNAYADQSDFETAISDYSKAIELNPENAEVYNNRGIAYRNIGNFDAAAADYTKAIELDPENAGVYYNRGVAYYKKGEFDAAFADYTKAIELDPEDADVYYNRGEAWLHLREWEKAKADLTTAKDRGFDIIAAFRNDYESVEDFEAKHGVQMPEDIAALLTRET